MLKKKKKNALDKEGIDIPKIFVERDAISAKWGTVSAVAAIITALISAGVLIYTVVQYFQISK